MDSEQVLEYLSRPSHWNKPLWSECPACLIVRIVRTEVEMENYLL